MIRLRFRNALRCPWCRHEFRVAIRARDKIDADCKLAGVIEVCCPRDMGRIRVPGKALRVDPTPGDTPEAVVDEPETAPAKRPWWRFW
jgi:hypothetical protein